MLQGLHWWWLDQLLQTPVHTARYTPDDGRSGLMAQSTVCKVCKVRLRPDSHLITHSPPHCSAPANKNANLHLSHIMNGGTEYFKCNVLKQEISQMQVKTHTKTKKNIAWTVWILPWLTSNHSSSCPCGQKNGSPCARRTKIEWPNAELAEVQHCMAESAEETVKY